MPTRRIFECVERAACTDQSKPLPTFAYPFLNCFDDLNVDGGLPFPKPGAEGALGSGVIGSPRHRPRGEEAGHRDHHRAHNSNKCRLDGGVHMRQASAPSHRSPRDCLLRAWPVTCAFSHCSAWTWSYDGGRCYVVTPLFTRGMYGSSSVHLPPCRAPRRATAARAGPTGAALATRRLWSARPGGTWHTAVEVPGIAALNGGGNAQISSVSSRRPRRTRQCPLSRILPNADRLGRVPDASDRSRAAVLFLTARSPVPRVRKSPERSPPCRRGLAPASAAPAGRARHPGRAASTGPSSKDAWTAAMTPRCGRCERGSELHIMRASGARTYQQAPRKYSALYG